MKLATPQVLAVFVTGMLVGESYQIFRHENTTAVLDNYSFNVGVWCAHRVTDTNLFSQQWDEDHSRLLDAARHFSQTNGWPKFNDP